MLRAWGTKQAKTIRILIQYTKVGNKIYGPKSFEFVWVGQNFLPFPAELFFC